MTPLTRILEQASEGEPRAQRRLAAVLYEELRAMAGREMARERAGHTLQPTALVHEAYLRLARGEARYESRAHFFGAAAEALRRVLVDHARRRASCKRGGDRVRVAFEDLEPVTPMEDSELLELDAALSELAAFAPTRARIVELRFFAGLTEDEVAAALGVSPSSVTRGWRVARAWLRQRLARDGR